MTRAALALLAVGGTALYAASFEPFSADALAAGIAAAVAWPAFALALLAATRARPSILAWTDGALATLAPGVAVLAGSVALNLAGAGAPGAHAAILVASNLVMGAAFLRRASALGLEWPFAAALWIGLLDALFVAAFLLFR